ncbi:hypothetical protein ACWIUD_12045 [Helicobacter sp. 23-1044]
MSKLRLLVGVGICGAMFGGCGFFTEWGDEVKDIWTKPRTASGDIDCVPSDLRERIAKYQEQYKNDDDMYPKVANMHNTLMFQQQKNYNTYSHKCSKYMERAYNEIIKENGAPKSYDEEVKFLDKVKSRFTRLFKLDNPNKLYEAEFED